MNPAKLKLNLRAKLFLVVSLGLLLVFSIFGAVRIYQAKTAVMDEINRSGQERVMLISESVANMVIAYDYSNLESLSERIVKMDDVAQIKVINRNGKVMTSRINQDVAADTPTLTFAAPVLFSGETIGQVEIGISLERIQKSNATIYRNIVFVFALFALIFGILIYASVYAFIIKPLNRLSEAANQLAVGDFSAVLPAATHDELGNLVRAFSIMRESRKQVEAELNNLNTSLENIITARIGELRESEAYIQAVLENVNEGIIVISEDGVIVSFNAAAEKIFGYASGKIINQNFSQLLSGVDAERYQHRSEFHDHFGVYREVEGIRKNLTTFPLELKTSQIHIQNRLLFITAARDISERKANELRINHIATHDTLTGLPNRALLQDRIQQTLIHNCRRKLQAAVLFIDLDKFKIINDTLGHDVGDGLLIEASSRLRNCVRGEDTIARQGGDEFIILLATIHHPEDAGIIAQKLLHELTQPFNIKGNELHIGASIGIAIFPDDGEDMESLLKNSDIAMYHAKESGRGNYQFFSPRMNEQAAEKQLLSNELRHAIDRNELYLCYQPIVEIATGNIVSLEALLRWNNPSLGMVSPAKFIPLAEETGLIFAIGEWVLKTTCMQIQTWQHDGYEVPRLVVNLSAKQFHQHSLCDTIEQLLQKTGLETSQLGLEITESMLIHHSEEVVNTLLKLSGMGLEISIDDFGTGYSSLSYLKRFPIHKLKIDKSFIDDLATHPEDSAIVRAIIAMAHGLQMKVVTEGVETQAQLDFLRTNGCEQYQGYLYSKPLTAAEITPKLKRCAA